MIARASIAFVALVLVRARAQPASIWVDVDSTEDPESEEVEKRYTPELIEDLETTKGDALLLYTEFQARASQSLKQYLRNISSLEDEARRGLEPGLLHMAANSCRCEFDDRLKKIRQNAYKAAIYNGEAHHKFFLGHMIVFRMHLNKSEEYIRRSEKIISACGMICERQPKIKRWRRMALDELNRVRDDMQHSRRMYRDLLTHAHRKLNTLRKRARTEAVSLSDWLKHCVADPYSVQYFNFKNKPK